MTQPALDLVIAALERIREKSDRAPRASRTALAQLQAAPAAFVQHPALRTAHATPADAVESAVPSGDAEARNKADLLAAVRERVSTCTKCAHLACSRTQTVFGVGNPDADLMFIGEAPGADEDQQGVLVALGAVAVEGLLGTRAAMRDLRGRWHTYNSIPLMITYHPAYLLRNQAPSEKRKVWEDMLQVLERLERPISERQRNYFL